MQGIVKGVAALGAVGLVGWCAGCGGAQPPMRAQSDAVAAVRSAEALDAAETPASAYQLELARGEMQQADALIRQGRMEAARDVLERAKADAELAMALRREAQAREEAEAAHEHLDTLRTSQEEVTSGGAVPPTPTGSMAPTAPTGAAQTTTTTVTTTATP